MKRFTLYAVVCLLGLGLALGLIGTLALGPSFAQAAPQRLEVWEGDPLALIHSTTSFTPTTDPDLSDEEETSEITSPYQDQPVLFMPSGLSLTPNQPQDSAVIAVFDDPAYVDTGGSTSSESDNVQAGLAAMGYTVHPFTGIDEASWIAGLAGANILVIPELENNSNLGNDLSTAARNAIRNFVNQGNGLIEFYHGSNFLNPVFGFSLNHSGGNVSSITAAAVGTAFEGGPATLPNHSATWGLDSGTFPVGGAAIYSSGGSNAEVAWLPYGAGQIVYLGWDWYDAAPPGSQDGGWLDVLDRAVQQVGGDFLGLYISPTRQYGPFGGTVVFTHTLVNGTGLTDTFTLTLSGNTWTTTVPFTVTPVLTDGAQLDFAVQVTIPGGAASADFDDVTVVATSVTSPTVFSATTTVRTVAVCADYLTISGRSNETYGDLDDLLEYGGQTFGVARITLFSEDSDTLDATLRGYDTTGSWVEIAQASNVGNITLFDDILLPTEYKMLNMQLDDTEDNDLIYYDYEFLICRSPATDLDPNRQEGLAGAGTTRVYTYTLTNYAMRDAQFDLAASGNAWPTTIHDLGGTPISQTPVLSDLDVFTFTTWVDVPGGAAPGETDNPTLTASEVVSPSIQDTVYLTTTVLSGQNGYVFNEDANTIHIIDTVIHQEVGSIDVDPYGNRPFRGAISPDGNWLYVGLLDSSVVVVISTTTDTPVGTIPVGDGPHAIAFDDSGDHAVVVNRWDDSVSIIDAASQTVIATFPVDDDPHSVAVDPTMGLAYVTNRWSSTVSVIDVEMQMVIDTIPGFNYPWDVVISPVGYRAYVSNQGNEDYPATGFISVIDTSGNVVIDTWTIPGSRWINSLDLSSDGTWLYVVDGRAGSTYVIDTSNGQVVATIPTSAGDQNWDIEVFPDWAGPFAYVTDVDDQDVKIVDTNANIVTGTITLSEAGTPRSLALFPPDPASRPPILALLPAAQAQIGKRGSVVTFTQWLYNETGSDDSFDLALSGNAWDAALSTTNTGPISDSAAISFTVWMTVPVGVNPGDSDMVTVQATSVANPGLYSATADLTATALSDQKGYIINESANTIHIIDTILHIEYSSINVDSYGNRPFRGAISPDGNWLYVGLLNSNRVLVISTTTDTPVGTVNVGSGPHAIAFDGSGDRAVVVNRWDDTASIIDTASQTVIAILPVGDDPHSVAVDPTMDLAYVTNRWSSTVSVIDVETQMVIDTIPGFDYPWDVVISPAGYRAYVSNQGNDHWPGTGSISVIDISGNVVIDTWTIPGSRWISSLDLSTDGAWLYVVDGRAGSTYVIDTSNGQVVATIPTSSGEQNWDIEVFPDGAGPFAYVTDVDDQDVKIIDTNANIVTRTITLSEPGTPRSLALFPPDPASRPPVLALLPAAQARGERPGNVVTFTEWIYNETGSDDSFDLTLSGNAWDAALSMTNIGPISDSAAISFTVWMTVPIGANVGDRDPFTVTATSQSAPGTSATAQLEAVATQFGYAFLPDDGEIAILDLVLHTVVGTIDTSPYGSEPMRGAIGPNGNWLGVTLRDSNQVLVVNTTTNAPATSITVGNQPHGIAFSNNGAYAFVVNQGDGTMSVINTVLQTTVLTIPVGSEPYNVATSPCLGKAYVTNKGDDTVSVFDFGTMTVTQVITGFSGPRDLVVSPYGHHVYVTNQHDGTIGVIDTADDTLFATWDIGGDWLNGIDVSPNGRKLYVADHNNEHTFVVDASSGQILAILQTGYGNWDAEVFAAPFGPLAYISAADSNRIHVVDTDNDVVNGSIPLNGGPRGLALFPQETTCSQGVLLVSETPTQYGQPGDTLVYTEWLYNRTGAADSFDLAASGNVWTTTLSTANSGLLNHGELMSFTVWVDIPDGVVKGDEDLVTVAATSVANPGVYSDTADLTSGYYQVGYAFLIYEDEIAVLNLNHHTILDTIDTSSYGYEPIRGAISPDGNWLYASLRDSGRVLVIGTVTGVPVTSIPVGSGPHGVTFSNDGTVAFVVNQGSGTVSVIDTASQTVSATLSVGNAPYNVATYPCLNKAYVTNRGGNTVSVIDLETMSVVRTITGFGGPRDVVIAPDARRAYVTNQDDGTIAVIDTGSDTLINTWDIGGDWLAGIDISPDGSKLYVAENDSPYNTYVVDTTTGQVIAANVTGGDTWDVEVFPNWDGDWAYVSVPDDRDIKVLDTTTDSIVGNIPLPGGPRGLALFPRGNVPPLAGDDSYTVTRNSVDNAFDVLGNDSDFEGDPLTIVALGMPDMGGTALTDGAVVTYTPAASFSGGETFTYTVVDSHCGLATAQVTVLVLNDNPLAVDDTYSTTIDVPLVVPAPGVLGNDVDINGDSLTAVLNTAPVVGVVDLSLDGSFTYTPTVSWSGLVTFTYIANDGVNDSNVAVVTINVNPTPIYTLTVNVVGSGSATPDPVGTLWPPTGWLYEQGTIVTLTAVPESGYEFVGWSDDLVSTLNPVTVTMTQNMTVTANFNQTGFTIYLPLVVRNH